VKKEGIKYVFYQDIYRINDEQLAIRAVVDVVCIINGKLKNCDVIDHVFADYFQ
jgi:acyl-CoA thioester hydrolase